jgi:hypothetical protein
MRPAKTAAMCMLGRSRPRRRKRSEWLLGLLRSKLTLIQSAADRVSAGRENAISMLAELRAFFDAIVMPARQGCDGPQW